MNVAQSYEYLMRSLDCALRYMDIDKNFNQCKSTKSTEVTIINNEETFDSNNWIERGIAETLYKITNSFVYQRNYPEAKKYASYAVQSCKNCLSYIRTVIEDKNQCKYSKKPQEQIDMIETSRAYFEIINLYLVILKVYA